MGVGLTMGRVALEAGRPLQVVETADAQPGMMGVSCCAQTVNHDDAVPAAAGVADLCRCREARFAPRQWWMQEINQSLKQVAARRRRREGDGDGDGGGTSLYEGQMQGRACT